VVRCSAEDPNDGRSGAACQVPPQALQMQPDIESAKLTQA